MCHSGPGIPYQVRRSNGSGNVEVIMAVVNKQEDILRVSAEVLDLLKSELNARGVTPTQENLSWVQSIIQKSLKPSISKLFVE